LRRDAMNTTQIPNPTIVLGAETAAELMTPNPVSIRVDATLHEAVAFLVDKGISGAPVIDEAGRPVGVLSQTDILVHDRENVEQIAVEEIETGAPLSRKYWESFQIEKVDQTTVADMMTPAVFSVGLDTPAATVIEEMRDLHVHRLFVVDHNGVLVGV